jgi:hypothetical protein
MSKFETEVLAQIDRCLYNSATGQMLPAIANFFSGTLFVECDEAIARKIWHAFVQTHGIDHVVISKVGPEYAFDFV